MGIKRYELSEAQWSRIAPLLPGKASDPGRTGSDNRLFVNGCLWVLRSGAHWCDLPERYGQWKTVHKRFSRWCHAGVWERVFATLAADRDNQYLMLDSTIVRAHQQAATGKGGRRTRRWGVPRGIDHQNPHARRQSWPSGEDHRHRRSGWRHHNRPDPARRSGRRGRAG
jgi:transposase